MPRLAAWNVLRSGSDTPMREIDRAADFAGLDARDRGLLRRIVGVEVRRRATLRAITAHFARGKPCPDLCAHLHIALAQLLFLDRIPHHAVLSVAGEATSLTEGRSKVGYVNGVLRNVLRTLQPGHSGDPRQDIPGRDLHLTTPVFHDPDQHPLLWAEDALSIPAPLFKRWVKRYGEDGARRLAHGFLDEPPLSIRIVRGTPADLLRELTLVLGEHPPWLSVQPNTLLAPAAATEELLASPAFAEGRVTIQGGAASTAAELVQAQPGERILDLCAAPGGKTAILAATGARVVACDVDQGRGARLRATVTRLGVSDKVEFRVTDGTSAVPETDFDAVLVDAPCSNTGVLGARPGARWRFTPKNRASLYELQQRLLREAAGTVRAGGRLVWSTCSLEPEENQRLVRDFTEQHPEWVLEEERATVPCIRTVEFTPAPPPEVEPVSNPASSTLPDPSPGPIDGGWAARLRRSE